MFLERCSLGVRKSSFALLEGHLFSKMSKLESGEATAELKPNVVKLKKLFILRPNVFTKVLTFYKQNYTTKRSPCGEATAELEPWVTERSEGNPRYADVVMSVPRSGTH